MDANARMITGGRLVSFIEKGSVESTHKVPTSHYRTKHCHAAVAPLGGLTHRSFIEKVS